MNTKSNHKDSQHPSLGEGLGGLSQHPSLGEGLGGLSRPFHKAFKRFSGKDFASDDLKREDALEDKYMSTVHNVLNGLLYLPDTEPLRRKAEMAVQLYKDFNFRVADGFEAEARKTLNMVQQWQSATDYTLAELGIAEWVGKAVVQAQKVLQLVTVRVDHESAKVKVSASRVQSQACLLCRGAA